MEVLNQYQTQCAHSGVVERRYFRPILTIKNIQIYAEQSMIKTRENT